MARIRITTQTIKRKGRKFILSLTGKSGNNIQVHKHAADFFLSLCLSLSHMCTHRYIQTQIVIHREAGMHICTCTHTYTHNLNVPAMLMLSFPFMQTGLLNTVRQSGLDSLGAASFQGYKYLWRKISFIISIYVPYKMLNLSRFPPT